MHNFQGFGDYIFKYVTGVKVGRGRGLVIFRLGGPKGTVLMRGPRAYPRLFFITDSDRETNTDIALNFQPGQNFHFKGRFASRGQHRPPPTFEAGQLYEVRPRRRSVAHDWT